MGKKLSLPRGRSDQGHQGTRKKITRESKRPAGTHFENWYSLGTALARSMERTIPKPHIMAVSNDDDERTLAEDGISTDESTAGVRSTINHYHNNDNLLYEK